jgi:hypothetical protein
MLEACLGTMRAKGQDYLTLVYDLNESAMEAISDGFVRAIESS